MAGKTSINWETLAVWNITVPFAVPACVANDSLSAIGDAPFLVSASLNAKFSIWRGVLYKLQVDAIVNSTCEFMCESEGDSCELLKAARPEVRVECEAAGECRMGDALLTHGCRLPAKFILHVVGPQYSVKCHNAAENILHVYYRNALAIARDRGLRSVAMGCISTQRKVYLREEAAHIA